MTTISVNSQYGHYGVWNFCSEGTLTPAATEQVIALLRAGRTNAAKMLLLSEGWCFFIDRNGNRQMVLFMTLDSVVAA